MIRPAIFRYFKTSPEIIRLAAVMDARYPLLLRNAEDLRHKRDVGRWLNNRVENSHQSFRRRERAMLRFRLM
jgi:transposase-like protein